MVRGLIAGFFEREYHGVDIREEQIKANEKILKDYKNLLKIKPRYYVGDSVNIDNIYQGSEVDFLFSCPPYVDLEVYSDKKEDLSNMNYNDFKKAYFEIIKKCFNLLKNDSFAVFVVGEARDKKGIYYNFVGDTITGFIEAGFSYYNEAILKNQSFGKAMTVEGYFKKSRKLGKIHQNILVFVKGDPVKATEKIGDIEVLKIDCEEVKNA